MNTGDIVGIQDAVKQFLIGAVLDEESSDEVDPDFPLIENGVIDSRTTLDLVAFLENEYDIEVGPHEVNKDNLGSLRIIEAFVQSKKKG